MHDRDVAGQQVRELGEEERRAQVAHQALVQEHPRIGGVADAGQDLSVDSVVALAAARRDDEVHAPLQRYVGLRAGGLEREPGGVDAEALPGLHLPLVRLLRDLPVVVEMHRRVHRVGREGRRVEPRRGAARQSREVGFGVLADTRHEPDAGNDDLAHHPASARSPIRRACSRIAAAIPSGKGMVLKRSEASQMRLPATAIAAFVTA